MRISLIICVILLLWFLIRSKIKSNKRNSLIFLFFIICLILYRFDNKRVLINQNSIKALKHFNSSNTLLCKLDGLNVRVDNKNFFYDERIEAFRDKKSSKIILPLNGCKRI